MRCPGHPCHDDPGLDAKRVNFHRVVHLLHRCVVSSYSLQKASVLQMCVCIVRIEVESSLEFLVCFGPVPFIFECLGQRKMSLWKGPIELERLGSRLPGVKQTLLRRMTSPHRVSQQDIGVG